MFLKKYGIHIALLIASAAIILVPYLKDEPDPEKINRATTAAFEFLQRIDNNDFEEARKEGAALLKERETLIGWVEKLRGVRNSLGSVIERKQIEVSYSTSAKDSPDGEYVMLTFNSQYQKRVAVSETVIVMLDKNRGWRVAGYFFK
ncbi:MAG: DUF4019 domain-containing protein [Desulfuromonadales bacterium]|nr:DUF4019 domain-containing protein [Desulfuromonadales bacterium]